MRRLPIDEEARRWISATRRAVVQILRGEDPRLLLIVGPCSIHHTGAAREYAYHLKRLSEQVADEFLILMRAHCEKPRTTTGWTGLLYDPGLDDSGNIGGGLEASRSLLCDLVNMRLPVATELLHPLSIPYFSDLVTWGQIGARTSSSQIHRQLVSGLDFPVGFKNSIDGNVQVAIDAVRSAQVPHNTLGIDAEGRLKHWKTEGNGDTHIVLRGAESAPNFDAESVAAAVERLRAADLQARLLIDCSHDNCRRQHGRQAHVFNIALHQALQAGSPVMGAIVESNLEAGSQAMSDASPEVSVTDPCLDWPSTETLILNAWQQAQEIRGHQLCRLGSASVSS